MSHEWMMERGEKEVPACALRSFPSSPSRASRLSSARGVARWGGGGGSWGARDPPLVGLRLSKQPTIFKWRKRHDMGQYLGRKSHCWKAHFFKICFFVEYFRQRLLSLVNMGLHAAIIRLSPLTHEGEQRYKPYIVGDPWMVSPLWKILATPLPVLAYSPRSLGKAYGAGNCERT